MAEDKIVVSALEVGCDNWQCRDRATHTVTLVQRNGRTTRIGHFCERDAHLRAHSAGERLGATSIVKRKSKSKGAAA